MTTGPGTARFTERRLRPEDWAGAVTTTDGPQLLVAGPGAGKTEFLVRRIAHLIDRRGVPSSSILAVTFSRRAAADFGNRLHRAVAGPAGGVGASTFHSLAYRLLERHAHDVLGWAALPSILTGPEQVDLVSELLAGDPPGNWPVPFRRLLDSRTLAHEVTDFILRAREQMLDHTDLARIAGKRRDWRALPDFIARYDAELDRRGRIDYGTLMTRAIQVLADRSQEAPEVQPYRYVLVDEYQDTTRAQAVLLRWLLGPDRNLTVAADPYQSIYGFRGADLGNVQRFADDFPAVDEHPVRRWVLATSFRTPVEILRAAERLTVGVDLPGAAGPVEAAAGPGRVEIRVFDQESAEAEWIAAQATRLRVEQEIPFHRMAVLVRTKRRFLRELSRALEQRSIPHERPDRRLADHPATRAFLDLARAALGSHSGPSAGSGPIRRLLLGPLFNFGVGRLRAVERNRRLFDMEWSEAIIAHVEGGEELAGLLSDPSWIHRTAIDGFWHAWTRLPQLKPFVNDPESGEFRAAWASLAQALARVADRDPSITLMDYIRLVESDDFEASPLLSYRDPTEDRMVLTTIHQTKGLEFDVVFIADAVEGVLPDLSRHRSLIQVEHLDPLSPSGPDRSSTRRLQEETRLLYTGMTRACRSVVLTATNAGSGEAHHRPSRFLDMIEGPGVHVAGAGAAPARPVTPREAETWLRRVLVDPAEYGHRRLAAATVLATASRPGFRTPQSYAAVRREDADHGLVRGRRRLSPSDALGYDRCPRQFALGRLLDVSAGGSPYLAFGALIHTVLENAERQAARENRPSTLDEALTILSSQISHHDFGTDSLRYAWLRRGQELLEKLYTGWPQPAGSPVLLEHPVRLELGGTTWLGRIDRIEQNPDTTLRIVDYKTGKTAPTKEEARNSLQLGFYYLASNADPAITEHGAVTGAEFWFPHAPTKKVTVRRFGPDREAETRRRLEEIARLIHEEDWEPRPGRACDRCDVRLVCPAWAEGQEAYRR
ncbi:MAG: ATP-dependent helicase [Acidimicrobiia bacterium]|nr:ATP-dependent helicase [Acidimicrobiia bacterium]